MSNTQPNPIISLVNGCLVIAGIASLIAGTSQGLRADITPYSGPGSVALSVPAQGQAFVQGSVHYAALTEQTQGGLVALGMLLILLGCSLHALFIIRNQKAHPVPLRRKVNARDLHPVRQYLDIFWVDLRK
ncbi:hypothetical protein COU76_04690 [Candidatus Peregrinibacteria bacterium CG10_big_fil_rev_8_21_14_0_10_49_10]|nr:MAG: hypothetical protein COU76_04690 [Candidatus Peregrinibacteria bacterium CG10_big_fil_rev_8_21_14_0_10_49_10]